MSQGLCRVAALHETKHKNDAGDLGLRYRKRMFLIIFYSHHSSGVSNHRKRFLEGKHA